MTTARIVQIDVDETHEKAMSLLVQAMRTAHKLLLMWEAEESSVNDEARLKRLIDASAKRVQKRRQRVIALGYEIGTAVIATRPDKDIIVVNPETLKRLVYMAWAGTSCQDDCDFLDSVTKRSGIAESGSE